MSVEKLARETYWEARWKINEVYWEVMAQARKAWKEAMIPVEMAYTEATGHPYDKEAVDKCLECGLPATHPSGLCRDCHQSKLEAGD